MNYLALKIAIAQLAMHGSYANITLKFLMEPRGGCSKYFQLESFKSISVCRKKKQLKIDFWETIINMYVVIWVEVTY